MDNTIKGFANYGVLAHEKQTIFTISNPHGRATASEAVEITLPDGWEVGESVTEGQLITGPAGTYGADDIIDSWRDQPVLSWYDGQQEHRIALEWKTI